MAISAVINLGTGTVPSTPGAGILYLYVDEADNHLKQKDENGTIIDLTETASVVEQSVLKSTAGTLAVGEVVYLVGDSAGTVTAELAQANSASTMPCIGIITAAATDSTAGTMILSGTVTGIDTSSFSVGDYLYVDAAVAGAITNVKPQGTNLIQTVGIVQTSAVSGIVLANIIGRVNALPNLAENYVWQGDSNGVPQEVTAASLAPNQTLQETYDLSTSPEIVTDATLGALTIKRGSTLDADDVLEILNGSSSQTFAVTGDGDITSSSSIALSTGTSVNEFSTDGTLAGDSDDAVPTEKAVKTYVDNNVPTVYPIISFGADQFKNPVNSDWDVNELAPASADTNNNGISVRRFDDTTQEGIGFAVNIPTGATNIILAIKSRAETSAGSNLDVKPRLHYREYPDNAAVESWAATDLTTITMGTSNEYFQYDSQTIALSTLSLVAGRFALFELTRNVGSGSDTLVGDWTLLNIEVTFS